MVTVELDKTAAIVFPGQGNQRVGGGLELAKRCEAAMKVWRYADQALQPHLKARITDIAWNGTEEQIQRTDYAQLIVTVESLSRAAALRETGQLGYPFWHVGNSVGMIAAYVDAGILTREAALQLALGRGEAFLYAKEHSPKGTMLAVNAVGTKLDRDKTLQLIDKKAEEPTLELCLINTDNQWVMGGPDELVEKAKTFLTDKGLKDKLDFNILKVDMPYHSIYMQPAVEIWKQVVANTPFEEPVNGQVIGGSTVMPLLTEAARRRELVLQLTEVERYRDVVWALRARGVTTFTEPNATTRLTRMNRDNFACFEGLTSQSLILPEGERLVIAHRLIVPWRETVSRKEVREWYMAELERRQDDLTVDEIEEGMSFVDSLGLESSDLMAIRAKLLERFGRVVPDDEAERNVYVGQAIDATYRLANS